MCGGGRRAGKKGRKRGEGKERKGKIKLKRKRKSEKQKGSDKRTRRRRRKRKEWLIMSIQRPKVGVAPFALCFLPNRYKVTGIGSFITSNAHGILGELLRGDDLRRKYAR